MVCDIYHTVEYLVQTSGHFFYMADKGGHTSEPSHENGLKLKPHGCHTASTQNSAHARKVVSVRFRVRSQVIFIGVLHYYY